MDGLLTKLPNCIFKKKKKNKSSQGEFLQFSRASSFAFIWKCLLSGANPCEVMRLALKHYQDVGHGVTRGFVATGQESEPNKMTSNSKTAPACFHLAASTAERSIPTAQMKLKRARLADDLNEKIALRPGPLELVEKNILPMDSSVKEAIKGSWAWGRHACPTLVKTRAATALAR